MKLSDNSNNKESSSILNSFYKLSSTERRLKSRSTILSFFHFTSIICSNFTQEMQKRNRRILSSSKRSSKWENILNLLKPNMLLNRSWKKLKTVHGSCRIKSSFTHAKKDIRMPWKNTSRKIWIQRLKSIVDKTETKLWLFISRCFLRCTIISKVLGTATPSFWKRTFWCS